MQLRTVLNAIKNHSQCKYYLQLIIILNEIETRSHCKWLSFSHTHALSTILQHCDNFAIPLCCVITTVWQFCNTYSVHLLFPFCSHHWEPRRTNREQNKNVTLLSHCCKIVTIVTPPWCVTSMLSFTFIFGGVKILFDIIVY